MEINYRFTINVLCSLYMYNDYRILCLKNTPIIELLILSFHYMKTNKKFHSVIIYNQWSKIIVRLHCSDLYTFIYSFIQSFVLLPKFKFHRVTVPPRISSKWKYCLAISITFSKRLFLFLFTFQKKPTKNEALF